MEEEKVMNEKGVSMVGLVLYINNVSKQKRDIIRFQINPILSSLIRMRSISILFV